MAQLIAACGHLCSECTYFGKNCEGCYAVKGSTFWAKQSMPDKTCPLYKCAIVDKKYSGCGQCGELPCKMFTDLKDPMISEEEHQKSLQERVARAKSDAVSKSKKD